MIGKENIEEKIFDYFEGDLSASESSELENFIQNNPEYQVDFDAWKNSTVEAEPMQYKFAEDLIVNERTSPKGWFKWASGGTLFLLISFASVGLFNKYDGGKERVASLLIENEVNNEGRIASDLDLKNAELHSLTGLKKSNKGVSEKDNVAIEQGSDLSGANSKNNFINKKNTTGSSVKRTNNGSLTLNSLVNKSPLERKKGDDSEFSVPYDKNSNDKQNLKEFKSTSRINVAALTGEKYVFNLPASLKKVKVNYENPNKPKLFVTNNKDPYLNYALGHTLEENGSFAGNGGEGVRAEFLYRTEWPSVSSESFTSQIFSMDGYVDALNGGVGVIVNADRIGHGKLNATAASLIYSPKFLVKGVSLEPSFKYTFNQKSISWNQVEENDVKDPRNGVLYASIPFTPESVLKSNLTHHDLGAGFLINANKFYLGAQVDHLNNASYSETYFDQTITIPTKISAMVGTDILKKKEGKFTFSPSLNYVKFGNYNTLWVNTQLAYQGFFFSGGLATNEELMASLGYGNNKVRLVYGLGFSKPSEFSGLEVSGKYYESHQLSLRVNLQPKKR